MAATDYELKLRAELDTTQAQNGLQGLGTVGVQSTDQLLESVKRLDNAIQDVTRSWKEQSDTQARAIQNQSTMLRRGARMLAGRLVGGAIEKYSRQAMDDGDYILGGALGTTGGVLKGAASGALFGPGGMAIGGLVGGLEEAFSNLEKSSKRLADTFDRITKGRDDLERQSNARKYEDETSNIGSKSTEELLREYDSAQEIIDKEKSYALKPYGEKVPDVGPISDRKDKSWEQILDDAGKPLAGIGNLWKWALAPIMPSLAGDAVAESLAAAGGGAVDKYLYNQDKNNENEIVLKQQEYARERQKQLAEAAEAAKRRQEAIKKELQERKQWPDANPALTEQMEIERKWAEEARALEAQKRKDEARGTGRDFLGELRSAQAEKNLAYFNSTNSRQKSLEEFTLGVRNMKPGEVQETIKALRWQQSQLESQYTQAESDVAATGNQEMADRAAWLKDEMASNRSKLQAAENALNSLSNGGSGVQSFFNGASTDLAKKGYDQGGYDSVENALFRTQVEATKKVGQDTERIANSMQEVKQYVEEIKNLHQNGDTTGATYG